MKKNVHKLTLLLVIVFSGLHLTGFSQCTDTLNLTILGGLDTSVFKASEIDNYHSLSNVAGNTSGDQISAFAWTDNSYGVPLFNGRTLLWFKIGSLPAGAVITHASLSMYPNLSSTSGVAGQPTYGLNNTALLQKITTPWKIDSTNFFNQPAVDTASEVILPQSTNTAESYSVDLTNFVTGWINNPGSNYGMLFRMQTENDPYNSMLFESGQAPENLKPELVISYVIPAAGISTVTVTGNTSNKFEASEIDNYASQFYPLGDTDKTYLEAFAWTDNSNGLALFNGRTLFKYDVSTVPPNSTIVSANLYLYAKRDNINGVPGSPTYGTNNTGLIQRINEAWDIANTNFNTQPTVSIADGKILPQSTGASQNYSVIITDFVQGWVNRPDSNYGMLLRMQTENDPYNSLIFESAHAADTTRRPKIIICYIPSSTLPLALDNFEGAISGLTANLWWTTHNEVNMESAGVEKSYDGSSFSAIGYLPAKNNTAINNYNFTDNSLLPHYSKVYYRLKLINKDGGFTYSNTLLLRYYSGQTGFTVFPNPAKNYTELSFVSSKDANVDIKVTDASGRLVIVQSCHFSNGYNTIIVNGLEKLAAGLYILQTTVNGQPVNRKIIVE